MSGASDLTRDTPDGGDELGTIDVLVIDLPDGWAGEGLDPLLELAARDVIRILDVEVVVRDEDGGVTLADPDAGPAERSGLSVFAGSSSHMLDDDDAAAVSELVAPGRTGLVVIYENVWTARLAAALERVDAHLLVVEHVSGDDLEAALGDD